MRNALGTRARLERQGYLFVLPFVVAFLALQLYPIIYTFALGLTDFRGMSRNFKFVGLENFVHLVSDAYFWKAFSNTWLIWGISFVPQLGLALLFAVWCSDVRLRLKAQGLFKAIFYLPNLLTAASIAVLYATLFYYPNGPINQALVQAGMRDVAFNFFRDSTFTRLIVAFIQFWMWYGHTLIMISAGIAGIPVALYESAVIDGANARQMFRHVTLPMLKPVMLYILVTSMIGGMQMFDIPYLITNRRGDPDGSILTTAVYLYNHAFTGSNNYAYASAISTGLFLLTSTAAILMYAVMRDRHHPSQLRPGKFGPSAAWLRRNAVHEEGRAR